MDNHELGEALDRIFDLLARLGDDSMTRYNPDTEVYEVPTQYYHDVEDLVMTLTESAPHLENLQRLLDRWDLDDDLED